MLIELLIGAKLRCTMFLLMIVVWLRVGCSFVGGAQSAVVMINVVTEMVILMMG